MSDTTIPKNVKMKIEELIQICLDGELLTEIEELISFLRNEKITLLWTSGNGYNLNFKSKRIGKIYFRDVKNHVLLIVDTAERGEYDSYLEGQTDDVVDLFMERVKNKCRHCRPTCGCSRGPGMNIMVNGNQYNNICVNTPCYSFINSCGSIQTMIMCSPNAVNPPVTVRPVSLDAVKKLILAKKAYIAKTLAAKK